MRRYQRRSGRLHFSGSCQPDDQRPGLWKADPRKRGFSGRSSSLPLRASGRLYQNSESGAGSDYCSGSLPSVRSCRRGHDSRQEVKMDAQALIRRLSEGIQMDAEVKRMEPLFENQEPMRSSRPATPATASKRAALKIIRVTAFWELTPVPLPPRWLW